MIAYDHEKTFHSCIPNFSIETDMKVSAKPNSSQRQQF